MLKLWKRTWQQGPGEEDEQSGDSDEKQNNKVDDAPLSGTSDTTPPMDDVILGPPDFGATEASALPANGTPSTCIEAELIKSGSPSKKRRKLTMDQDSIAQHLPELHEDTIMGDAYLHASADREDQIFANAKKENIIASLSTTPAIDRVVFRYLAWSVKVQQSQPSGINNRVSALVVDDDATLDSYARKLETERGFLSIKVVNPSEEDQSADWAQALLKDVVVVTASTLLDSLREDDLSISQFHAIVIPDAQTIKDQDSQALVPVSRIMSEFYRAAEHHSRPMIFAIAKAPHDEQDVYDSGLFKLEDVLDAKVFGLTMNRRAELMALPEQPSEIVLLYNPPPQTIDLKLLLNYLHKIDPTESVFAHFFRAARYALLHVGACASDLVWRRALKSMPDNEFGDYARQDGESVIEQRLKTSMRDAVKNWAFAMPNLDATSRGFNVTPKFLRLVQILKSYEAYGESFRGIIFVEKRAVALAIADMLRALDDQFGFLRPLAVVGCGAASMFDRQQEIFRDFTAGTYNLLIATKSIEDLDVPKAPLVVRFDLFESHVSHAYVKAHTRGRESHLVYLLERSNDIHRRILAQISQQDSDMLRWTENLGRDPRSSIPPRSLRETNNPYHSDSEGEDDDDDPDANVRDPVTNGRIYPQDATTVIYRFASTLASDVHERRDNFPLFEYDEAVTPGQAHAYRCRILLPVLGMPEIPGPSSISLAHARRAACHQACRLLFNAGLLDCHIFPQIDLPNAELEASMTMTIADKVDSMPNEEKTGGLKFYTRAQPAFWKNSALVKSDLFYPTIVTPLVLSPDGAPYAPMLILTRLPLPAMLSFKLFFVGVPASLRLSPAAPFRVTEPQIHDLHMYTVRICRTIGNKPYICDFEKMLYFWAPLQMTAEELDSRSSDPWVLPVVGDRIPWEDVTRAAATWALPLRNETTEAMIEDLKDAVIQDRWVEFTRRYDVEGLRQDLTPLSKAEDSAREAEYANFLEYCKARRKGFEGLQDENQPLIQVSKCQAFLNRLNPTSRNLTESTKASAKYLIPELCAKFTIPSSSFRTALLLPSVMKRIDEFLIVKQLNAKYFDFDIAEVLLHMAISTPSSAIEYDYERLELLGDSFLKYLSSVYVFVTHPTQPEGSLHFIRQRIISNKSLYLNSRRAGFPQYIHAKPFTVKLWCPPNFELVPPPPPAPKELKEGEESVPQPQEELSPQVVVAPQGESQPPEGTNKQEVPVPSSVPEADITVLPSVPQEPTLELEPGEIFEENEQEIVANAAPEKAVEATSENAKPKKRQPKRQRQLEEQNKLHLGDKTIADVSEAIIGAAYISGGRETALKAAKALNIPTPNVDRWSDFGRKVLAPHPNYTAKLASGAIEAVETIIGHKFHRPHLLAQALTHASSQEHEATSYERLEFLGDAILDFMVIRHIFDRDQQLSPGGLTLLKGAMVSNSTLAAVCVSSGLKEYLLFESHHLAQTINVYADQLRKKEADEYAAAQKEGRSPGQYWLELEPPKALSDVVESIIGAIYISDNFSPVGAEALFDNVLKPFYDRYITLKTLSHHPTKTLFELFQAQGCQHFEIEKESTHDKSSTCSVLVHDIVLASAQEDSTALAARRASLFALDALEGDPEFLTRTCDCRSQTTKRKGQKKDINSILSGFGEEEEADLLAANDGGLTSAPTEDGKAVEVPNKEEQTDSAMAQLELQPEEGAGRIEAPNEAESAVDSDMDTSA
ncbi:hypothetical protein HGRIS_009773 [Hohenbuehelia grisea]|uniref:Dicer-like protein 1 n=1 Tax=Hohenbuehelia grisea TaxID=104357 RepID=A0ABR3J2M2_9AGAR